jgi:hypothetical protein
MKPKEDRPAEKKPIYETPIARDLASDFMPPPLATGMPVATCSPGHQFGDADCSTGDGAISCVNGGGGG